MKENTRTERLSLALTEMELEQVRLNAAWHAMTVSAYMRHAALGGTVERPAMANQRETMREALA